MSYYITNVQPVYYRGDTEGRLIYVYTNISINGILLYRF